MTEKSPLTSPPSDAGKEEARKLYEEVIAASKKSLKETRERTHIDQIKNEKKREEAYEKFIKPIEEEIAAKEAEMRRALGSTPAPKAPEESDEIKLKRSWEKAREEKRGKEKEAREQKRKARVEKKGAAIKKFISRISPQEPPVLFEQRKGEEEQKEEKKPKYPWEDEEKIQAKIKENEEIEQKSPKTLEELQKENDVLSASYQLAKKDYREEIKSAKTDAERDAALKDLERTKLLLGSVFYRKFYKERHGEESSGSSQFYKKSGQRLSAIEDLKFEFFDTYYTYRKKEVEELNREERLEREKGSQEAWAPEKIEERENQEGFEILEVPEEEFAPSSRAATPPHLEEKDERKEKWPSTVARVVDKVFNKFEEAKYGEDRLRLNRLRNLKTDVEGMINTYQSAAQQGWPPLPDEESRLLQLKRDIENELESTAEKAPTPPPSGKEVYEVEPRKEPQTREERIAAFRARREEIEKKNKEEGWDSDEDFQKFGMESSDRGTAEHYNFDPKKIDEAIEEAKKENNPRYREQSIERLQRAKALIEKEIGAEAPPPTPEPLVPSRVEGLAEKKDEGIIEPPLKIDMPKEGTSSWSSEDMLQEDQAQKKEEKKTEPTKESVAEAWSKAWAGKKEEGMEKKEEKQESKAEKITESKAETKEESPKMKAAIEKLLGEELGRDAQMREAARAVVEARHAMREALATRKIERLYIEAGSDFFAPERLQEAEQIEKVYEDALVGLSARLRESTGNNEEAFLAPYLNIQNAEAMRIAQMREAALLPGRRSTAVRFYQRLNNPFNSDIPPRWARYVRVGLTAAVLGGSAAAFGGLGAGGIAVYAGWRASKALTFAAANGIAQSGIDMAFTRHADTMMGEEKGKQRTAMQEALKNNERIEALKESMRASIRAFQGEAAAQLENRKFYGRAAMFGLMGLSGLVSYELARPSAVAADKGAFGAHIATNEDVLRQRFYEAYKYVFGGKPSAEVIEDVIGKGGAGGVAEAARRASEAAGETAPSGSDITSEVAEILTDEQREEGLKQYYGLVESAEKDRLAYLEKSLRYAPSDEWREEALKRYYGLVEAAEADRPPSLMTSEQAAELHELQEKGVLTDEQIDNARKAWEGRPPLLDAEEIEKLQALREKGILSQKLIDNMRKAWEGKLDALGKEPMATIGKGSNIWEASRSLIGEGEGKISKEQWLEAWEKSTVMIDGKEVSLRDAWLVHKEDALRFVETPQGPRLELIDAKDAFKVGTYKELAQAYDALGKEKPPALREALAQEQHLPSAAKQLENLANTKIARPAADPSMFEGIKNAPTAEGGSLAAILENPKSYISTFEKASFADQEATIQEWERTIQDLRNLKGQPNIDQAFLDSLTKTEKMFAQLQENEAYLQNARAWEALKKEWGRKVGVSEAQFAELSDKWTVGQFLDIAKKIENRDFVPSDPLSKVLEARRLGTLEMAEKIQSKLPDRAAIKTPLGRFLKNTL